MCPHPAQDASPRRSDTLPGLQRSETLDLARGFPKHAEIAGILGRVVIVGYVGTLGVNERLNLYIAVGLYALTAVAHLVFQRVREKQAACKT